VSAGLLGADLVSGLQLGLSQCANFGNQRLVFGRCLPVPDGFASVTHQVVNRVDRDVALLVAVNNRSQHDFFAQLAGFGFDHQHSSFSARNHQIHFRIFELGLAWVQHILAINIGHSRSADGAVEWNAGNSQRGARGNQRRNVAFHFRVERQHVNHDLHLVEEAFRKQRANRAVDQA
jgi:hypothetical protein